MEKKTLGKLALKRQRYKYLPRVKKRFIENRRLSKAEGLFF